MTKAEVIALLKEHRNDRGIAHWQRLYPDDRLENGQRLKSFGIGLTQLRKLAKQIGRDHKLAQQLWKADTYEAKVLGLLIDDPKVITREQAERQVEQLHGGMLTHIFASCDATLAKMKFAFDLAKDWVESEDAIRRRCGYSLLYELSKKNPKGMDDAYLLERIAHIEANIHDEDMWVREAMNTALMGIGKRNITLNKAAVKAAKKIGPVEIDYGPDNSCEVLDVLKHLMADHLQQRLKK